MRTSAGPPVLLSAHFSSLDMLTPPRALLLSVGCLYYLRRRLTCRLTSLTRLAHFKQGHGEVGQSAEDAEDATNGTPTPCLIRDTERRDAQEEKGHAGQQ